MRGKKERKRRFSARNSPLFFAFPKPEPCFHPTPDTRTISAPLPYFNSKPQDTTLAYKTEPEGILPKALRKRYNEHSVRFDFGPEGHHQGLGHLHDRCSWTRNGLHNRSMKHLRGYNDKAANLRTSLSPRGPRPSFQFFLESMLLMFIAA